MKNIKDYLGVKRFMKTKEKVITRVSVGSFFIAAISFISSISGLFPEFELQCQIIAGICSLICLSIIIWLSISALLTYISKKGEKVIIDELKRTIDNLNNQYQKFQQDSQKFVDKIGDQIVCPAYIKTFEYNSTDVTRYTNQLLEKHPNSEIHIICFGRNGYGDVIEHIREKGLKVKAKIIVYNPQADVSICKGTDYNDICKHIRNMLSSDIDVEVFASNIPPSIRACVIYEKDKAIWGAMQSYRFERKKGGGFSLKKPTKSLIATCGEDNCEKDFSGLISCFENEFKYLLKDCCKPELENDNVKFKKKVVKFK